MKHWQASLVIAQSLTTQNTPLSGYLGGQAIVILWITVFVASFLTANHKSLKLIESGTQIFQILSPAMLNEINCASLW